MHASASLAQPTRISMDWGCGVCWLLLEERTSEQKQEGLEAKWVQPAQVLAVALPTWSSADRNNQRGTFRIPRSNEYLICHLHLTA